MYKRQGLKLLCVELAFEDRPFELNSEDADKLVQVRSNSIMWQKERLLNIGLDHLPEDCDKIAWLDSDIIFENENWVQETCELLEKYIVVRPFSFFVALPENYESFDIFNFERGTENGQFLPGFSYTAKNIGFGVVSSKICKPGIAWAAKRELIDSVKFFDKAILGGGDDVMACAFLNKNSRCNIGDIPSKLKESCKNWETKFLQLWGGAKVFYTNGIVLHLWHGEYKNRSYQTRYDCAIEYDFDPDFDLAINKYGCFEWRSVGYSFRKSVENYFFERKEDL